jgi:hypothetical protein
MGEVMQMKRAVLAGAGISLIAATASAAVVVSVPALQDAMIFGTSGGADTNNASGKGPAMFMGADGSSNRKRGEIEFDIASAHIPTDATITDVTMTLYLAQVAGSGGGSGGGGNFPTRIISAYDMLQAWGEGTSGSPTSTGVGGTGQGYTRVTGDSSWDYAFYNSADTTTGKWNNGTTDLHGGNFSATASATSTFTNFTTLNAPFTWTGAGMVADVQSWVDGSPNYGWLLKSDNLESSPTSFLGFWTKDGAAANSNPNIAPSLTITYSVVPEPSTGLLLLVVASARLFRRARSRTA